MQVTEGTETTEVPFAAYRVDPELSQKLDQFGVTVRGQPESALLRDLLSRVAPVLLFVGREGASGEGAWQLRPRHTHDLVAAPGHRRGDALERDGVDAGPPLVPVSPTAYSGATADRWNNSNKEERPCIPAVFVSSPPASP